MVVLFVLVAQIPEGGIQSDQGGDCSAGCRGVYHSLCRKCIRWLVAYAIHKKWGACFPSPEECDVNICILCTACRHRAAVWWIRQVVRGCHHWFCRIGSPGLERQYLHDCFGYVPKSIRRFCNWHRRN